MTKDEALAAMKALLLKYGWPEDQHPPHAKVDIYTWKTGDLRIAEVSFSNIDPVTRTGGGSSFMQCDVESGNAIFHVERAVLAFIEDEDKDDKRDACWRMIYAACGENAAKAFSDEHP
jgi:hypothetical protein